LDKGAQIQPNGLINTDANSKLFLRWQGGLFSSMGESSSLSSATEGESGQVSQLQMVQGAVRFTTDTSVTNPPFTYSVVSPLVTIQPAADGQPVDYTVEVYNPTSTMVTVISGKVRIVDRSGRTPQEGVYEACHVVNFTQGKKPEIYASNSSDMGKIVGVTTMAGTLPTPDTCPIGVASAPRAALPARVRTYVPEYYVDSGFIDYYPYASVPVYPYGGYGYGYGLGGFLATLAAIGSWFIPYNYAVSPAVVSLYVNSYLINQGVIIGQQIINNYINAQEQLQLARNVALSNGDLAQAQQLQGQLNQARAAQNWATARVGELQNRLTTVNNEIGRFQGQLPRGADLARTVADSFNSPRNATVARNFQDRLRNQMALADRMTGLGQQQVDGMRANLASVRDPSQRLALSRDAAAMQQNLLQGKVPITRQTGEIGNLARQLGQQRDPATRMATQNRLLASVKTTAPNAGTENVLSRGAIGTLPGDIGRVQNPALRQNFTQQLSALQQAAQAREQQVARLTPSGGGTQGTSVRVPPTVGTQGRTQLSTPTARSNQAQVNAQNNAAKLREDHLRNMATQAEQSRGDGRWRLT